MAGGIGDQVGSLEVGKFADILITSGDITDPRHTVELALQQGQVIYDAVNQKRRW
jgi:imidazolonepropionase-like amidohydrolase